MNNTTDSVVNLEASAKALGSTFVFQPGVISRDVSCGRPTREVGSGKLSSQLGD